jgi:hypothetical protein
MKVLLRDCQQETNYPEWRPKLSECFSYGEVMELPSRDFKQLIGELTTQPQPPAVLGAPFIDYNKDEDLITVTVYNNYVE